MGIIERIVVSDETMKRLEEDARRRGTTIEREAADRIENEVSPPSRDEMIARLRAFRDSLPPQTSDSLTLLREGRDR